MKIKNNIVSLIKNFFYVIFSNAITVVVSILVVLIVPKYIGVSNYGYWQLYILFTSFVGFLHFGWNDGLYLRLGGSDYKDIDKALYYSQFYLLVFTQLFIAALGLIAIVVFSFEEEKEYLLYMTAICMFVVNVRYMLLFLLQATYRIKAYSFITISDRVIYLFLIALLLFFGADNFKYFIWADITGKLISLIVACICCRDFVFKFKSNFYFRLAVKEIIENIRVGIKLMFSNVASKLVIGNVRFGIESAWSVVIFGKVSLMLSVTGFVMIFINSISLVLFPFLRKVKESNLDIIYVSIRQVLTLFLLVVLITYYPVSMGLKLWLPDYKDALKYLLVIYPIIIFEGKMALLVNTYLKVLRKENTLLKINIFSLILSFATTYVSISILRDLNLAVYSILFLIAVRVIAAELYLQKVMNIKLRVEILIELLFVIVFVVTNALFDAEIGFVFYCISLAVYLVLNKKSLFDTYIVVKDNVLHKV